VIYDAEHFFDGWKPTRVRRETIRRRPKPGAKLVVLCDTNGGSMPEEIAR
jgi:2-isopropylmalate synthase